MPAQILPFIDSQSDQHQLAQMSLANQKAQMEMQFQQQEMALREAHMAQQEQLYPLRAQLMQQELERGKAAGEEAKARFDEWAQMSPDRREESAQRIKAMRLENEQRAQATGQALERFGWERLESEAKQRKSALDEKLLQARITDIPMDRSMQESQLEEQKKVTAIRQTALIGTLVAMPDDLRESMVPVYQRQGIIDDETAKAILAAPIDTNSFHQAIASTLGQAEADQYDAARKLAATQSPSNWGYVKTSEMRRMMDQNAGPLEKDPTKWTKTKDGKEVLAPTPQQDAIETMRDITERTLKARSTMRSTRSAVPLPTAEQVKENLDVIKEGVIYKREVDGVPVFVKMKKGPKGTWEVGEVIKSPGMRS